MNSDQTSNAKSQMTIMESSNNSRKSLPILTLCSTLLFGCQSIPTELELESDPRLALAIALQQPENYIAQPVRWGGTVVKVDNAETSSRIEIVAYPLNDFARPLPGQASDGRFIAELDGFIDPMVYTQGREVTVSGTISGKVIGSIGEYEYTYPLVSVKGYRLWQPRSEVEIVPVYRPYWYDPWYPYHYYYLHGYPIKRSNDGE
jgi:outer membrane lipoprotein